MEIRRLTREKYEGFPFEVTYVTKFYYDVELLDLGFRLVRKEFDQPTEKSWSGDLFGDWLEEPVVYGAFEGEELLGFVESSKESWHNAFRVSNLFVYEPYRGRKIGETLLSYMIDHAKREADYRGIILETQTCNFPAISLYQKLGFRLCRIDVKEYTNQDVAKKEVRIDLWKEL